MKRKYIIPTSSKITINMEPLMALSIGAGGSTGTPEGFEGNLGGEGGGDGYEEITTRRQEGNYWVD